MDGRGILRLGVFLLIAAAGCQHQVISMPNPGSLSQADRPPLPDPSQIKKAPTKAKDLPPAVLVSFGDFKAGEALAADISSDRQQQIRELARKDYEEAIKLDPKCVPAYQGLARLHTAMQDYGRAVENYQKALQIDAKNAPLWYELGMCHNCQKNWEPALECLSRAAQFDPGNRSYVNAEGIVLAQAGRYDESLNCFVRSSNEALGYYRLALTLQRLQQPELSQRYLAVALQKDPNLAAALAMRKEGNDSPKSANPPLQQTTYQAASYPTPSVPATPTAPAPAPRVIQVDASVSETQPAQQQVILPPPPPVNIPY